MNRMGSSPLNQSGPSRWRRIGWAVGGLTLIGLCIALYGIAPLFPHETDSQSRPIELFVTLAVAAGAAYLLAMLLLWRAQPMGRRWGGWIVLVGLGMRAILFISTPMLEVDYYRYQWDGAVVARGISPYLWTPGQARESNAPQPLIDLAQQAPDDPPVLYRIRYPGQRSMYPPVSELAFGAAHRLMPWNRQGLRAVFLLFDAMAALLIVLALRRLGRPVEWVAVYWWCPITVIWFINGIHFDPIVICCAAAAVTLLLHRWIVLAYAVLALAIGAKLWPIIFVPLFLRYTWANRRATFLGLLTLGALAALMFVPYVQHHLGPHSGFLRFVRMPRSGSAHVEPLIEMWQHLCPMLDLEIRHAPHYAHLTLGALLSGWVVALSIRPIRDARHLVWRCTLAVSGLFLLSPMQFPWYYGWVAAFLALRPWWPMLLYTLLLPLSLMQETHPIVPWLQHAPVWVMLAADYAFRHRHVIAPTHTADHRLSSKEKA